MAETFVKVGMEVVGDKEILVEQFAGRLVDYEFFVETIAMAGCIICLGDILDSYRF